jgi:hypothetical protein
MSRNTKILALVGTVAVIGGGIYLYGKTTHQRPLIKVGAPTLLSAAKAASKKCRAGEIKRGGFCATPDYWAELDAGTPA